MFSLLILFLLVGISNAFLVPGSRPVDYADGAKVPMYVNKIWSKHTQLPYNYYSLPFCRPNVIETESSSIGQILIGDRVQNSDYELFLNKNETCKVLCHRDYSQAEANQFVERINDEYSVNWIMDGLPAAVRGIQESTGQIVYLRGFDLGVTAIKGDSKQHYLINHIHFFISVYPVVSSSNEKSYRIVGFEVQPVSVVHKRKSSTGGWTPDNLETCDPTNGVVKGEPLSVDGPVKDAVFTYNVFWRTSTVPWANRWSMYLSSTVDTNFHMLPIFNSVMIALFMMAMIASILLRTIYRQISDYNGSEDKESDEEEVGWKLVHGDVFRPPSGFFGPMFLSVFVGAGAQVLAMSIFLLFFAIMGVLSPENQGSLVTGFIFLFVLMGSFAGYFSARLYKLFKGKAWKRNTFLTAFSFSGSLLLIAILLNFFVWYKRSSLAIPFKYIVMIVSLWLFICAPLVAVGAYFGFKADELSNPRRVNNIPRQVPPQPWYLNPVLCVLAGGILPFAAIFTELHFILSAIWLSEAYLLFGVLAIAMVLLIITCAEISIVLTYFQLSSEDYNWWWRSFLTSGSSALYIFLYSIAYFHLQLEIHGTVSTILYFGYMFMLSWVAFLLTGSVGFISSLLFVRKIYGALKFD